MTEPLSTEDNAPLASIGRYHKLCERCKKFGQVLWRAFTFGLDLMETAKDAGFETRTSYFSGQDCFIDLGIPEELVPNFCHLCTILKAMSDASVPKHRGVEPDTRARLLFGFVRDRPLELSLPAQELESQKGPQVVRFAVHLKSELIASKAEFLELNFYDRKFWSRMG